jgi:glutaminyl-tRNA synthetase
LFSNLILQHSDKVQVKDIEEESLTKLYTMSLKSQMAAVRILAIENLQNDLNNFSLFQIQLSEVKNNEKNEKVLQLLNALKI